MSERPADSAVYGFIDASNEWKPGQVDSNGNLKVALGTAQDIEIGAVEIKNSTDDTRAVVGANGLYVDVRNVQAGTAIIGKVGIDQTTPGTTNGVQVNAALPAGTNLIGKFSIDQVTANANEVVVKTSALPTGAATEATLQTIDADTGNISSYTSRLLSSANAIGASNTLATTAFAITGQYNATPPTLTDTQSCGAQMDTAGNVKVNLATALPTGTNVVGKVGYKMVKVSTSFTRPADTNAYAVGDTVSNSTSAPVVFQLDLGAQGAVNGQAVEVLKLAIVSSAKQSTLPYINAFLSNTTFTASNDNAAFDIADATVEAGGAFLNCDVQNYTASNSRVAYVGCSVPMLLAAADTKLYGMLQAANAYTPVSEEKFTIVAWVALL